MRAFLCKIFGCENTAPVTKADIIAALGGEPLLKQPEPVHDAAGLDREIAALR